MDRTRSQLLTDSALPGDQNAGIRLGTLPDQFVNLQHFMTLSNQLSESSARLQLGAQVAHLQARCPLSFSRP